MVKAKIILKPQAVLKYLLIAITFLVLTNLINIYLTYFLEINLYPNKLFRLFYLDAEDSLGTVFSFLQLLAASILLFILFKSSTKESDRTRLGWLGLSLIFLYLSLDEILELHETLILLFRTKFNLSGLLYFSWIVPYSIGVIIFSILYFPFMRNLRKKTALSFLIAGTIFIIGAVGIEMIDGNYFETYGADINYSLWTTLEEFLEMIGISYFIYALLKHLALNETDLLLSVDK